MAYWKCVRPESHGKFFSGLQKSQTSRILLANLGCVGCNGVEDVDEEEEEDDEEAHSTSNLVHRDQERHPGYDDKQTCGVKNVNQTNDSDGVKEECSEDFLDGMI